MTNRKSFLTIGITFALSVFALASKAHAVPVISGAAPVPTPGTTSAARPDLAGVIVADVIRPFSVVTSGGKAVGWVQDRVVRSNLTGTLDFYYRIHVDPSSEVSLVKVTRDSFWSWPDTISTDVDWRIDGVGQRAPWRVWRNDDGQWIYIDHSGGATIHPGETSRFVFVKTNAKEYSVGYMWLNWTPGGAFGVSGFQPKQ
jgi:hypothetical protein